MVATCRYDRGRETHPGTKQADTLDGSRPSRNISLFKVGIGEIVYILDHGHTHVAGDGEYYIGSSKHGWVATNVRIDLTDTANE